MSLPSWRITRRDLRLGSGLVLFTYVSFHFVGHTSGLYSIDVAERVLEVAVAIWQSVPGTLLLYTAAAIHVALAFLAVYDRRTLRMPPEQLLRIALGFGMPLLLIGHLAATRVATELYSLAPTYHRIVWTLWTSGSEGRQLALLAPGWLHGCMGLNFAFGHRPGWQRLKPVLFAVAVLLPVLAGLGFLAMGRELAALGDAAGVDSYGTPGAQRTNLGLLRDGLLYTWFALIGLAFAARIVRTAIERRRRALVRIAYPQRSVEVPRGWTVLEASRGFSIPHLSMCGGSARCSTCRVRVIDGLASCPPPGTAEQRTLARIRAPGNVRLACQLRPQADVAVVPLLDAVTHAEPASARIVERDLALLVVRVIEWRTIRGSAPTAHDLVYALDRFHAIVGDAVSAAGAFGSTFDTGGATASFGFTTDLPTACRQALSAARVIDEGLVELDKRLAREVGFVADVALVVHAGPAVIGPLGYGRDRTSSAFGDAVVAMQRLTNHAAQTRTRFTVSKLAATASALAVDDATWRALPGSALEIMTADRAP